MSEPNDQTGRSDTNRRLPRSQGWRWRTEKLRGQLAPDPSWVLSASEIGAFTFCPQADAVAKCVTRGRRRAAR